MTKERDMVRVNTRISAEVNDWLDERSKKTGVPKSAIIHTALDHYIMQLRSVDALQMNQNILQAVLERLEKIEGKVDSL